MNRKAATYRKVPLDAIEPWEKNPRNIKKKDFERLKRQILKLGVYKPLLCYEENGKYVTLGGNMRLRALRELGVKDIMVGIVRPKSEAEKIEYNLSDNDRAGEYIEQDLAELIYPYLEEINLEDFKVDLGEAVDMKSVIDDYGPSDEKDDEIPEIDDGPAITKPGDLFTLGRHRLLCGDATKEEDVKRLMNDKKASICITDPPYSADYGSRKEKPDTTLRSYQDPKNAGDLLFRFMSTMPTECLIMTYTDKQLHPYVLTCEKLGFETIDLLIWKKQNFCFWPGARYQQQHELIFLVRKKGARFYSNTASNDSTVWEIDRETRNNIHPTARPLMLWEKIIKNHTRRSDLIYDPFLGSGTTIIASEKLNRICYGMEISPYFCDVTITRFSDFTGIPEEEIRATVERA